MEIEMPETTIEETPAEITLDEETTEVEETPEVIEEEAPIDVEAMKVEIREKQQQEEIDYGDDIDPDDVKTIGSIVEKQAASRDKRTRDIEDKLEVATFISERPEFSKYKPAILKYMAESPDVYGRIPIKNIANMLAGDDLMSLGAKREREAQIKANSTKTGGSTPRTPQGGSKDWVRASKDDFEAQKRAILQRR